MIRYILYTSEIDIPELADRLIEKIFSKLDFSKSIVNNKDSIFTSKYGRTLYYYMMIKRYILTVFYPQIDDQIKWINQIFEYYLRYYINNQQDNWIDLLFSTEYLYNQNMHTVTERTLFEIVLQYKSEFHIESIEKFSVRKGKNEAVRKQTRYIGDAFIENEELGIKTQEMMIKFYNKKYMEKIYRIDNEIMLSSKNIRIRKTSKKLTDKFLGPFKVRTLVSKNIYQLELPQSYSRIHSTFHMALSELYYRRERIELSEPVLVQKEKKWEIEQVLDKYIAHRTCMFLVGWKKFTRTDDSGKPEENLTNAKDKIAMFQEERTEKRT